MAALAFLALGSAAPASSTNSLPPGGGWRAASYRVNGASPVLAAIRRANGSAAYVAWIDHTATRLALYPGLRDPPFASPRGRGEVPAGQRWRLLATFNGGFKSSARAGGFVVNGRVDEPLGKGFGTLVEYADGSLAILKWEGRTKSRMLVLARQNLPPLVWDGRPSPAAADVARWGATLGGGAAVWRTGVGVTQRGDLVFAAAGGQTPLSLAALMVELGAVRAIELDINPEWASFDGYLSRGGRRPLKVVPNTQQSAYRFLTPDNRDFFAVYTRTGGVSGA
jgi:Phosphodiester glycosidase